MPIVTPRLVLREWEERDRESLTELVANPRVMEFFPALLLPAETDAMLERIRQHYASHGFGFWVVEIPGELSCAGLLGLSTPRFTAHFTPCVEIGWRLTPAVWGRGIATEGAAAALQFGFDELQLSEIVAFTSVINVRSRRVMEKLGMKHDPQDDFDHPFLPIEHRLSRHVLYRQRAQRVFG